MFSPLRRRCRPEQWSSCWSSWPRWTSWSCPRRVPERRRRQCRTRWRGRRTGRRSPAGGRCSRFNQVHWIVRETYNIRNVKDQIPIKLIKNELDTSMAMAWRAYVGVSLHTQDLLQQHGEAGEHGYARAEADQQDEVGSVLQELHRKQSERHTSADVSLDFYLSDKNSHKVWDADNYPYLCRNHWESEMSRIRRSFLVSPHLIMTPPTPQIAYLSMCWVSVWSFQSESVIRPPQVSLEKNLAPCPISPWHPCIKSCLFCLLRINVFTFWCWIN